jgi:antitoxin ParD1/3/4
MDQITITFPDPAVRAFVNQLVATGMVGSVNDYILALIDDDRKRRAQEELEARLLEGLEGELTELTDQDWEAMRRRYDERHPQVNGS